MLQGIWGMFEIVSDGTYSFTVNIRVQINCCWHYDFSYNTYKKYVQDPKCYDRRSEKKKMKHGTKLQLMREFPVSIWKVVLTTLLTTYNHSTYYLQLHYSLHYLLHLLLDYLLHYLLHLLLYLLLTTLYLVLLATVLHYTT
jgi:hypothetical protein